jgi:peptidyl-prolyl cis-trans isomerase SurA
MKRFVAFVSLALAAGPVAAQQPAPAPAQPQAQQSLLLDGVVAVVGDQTITMIDLRERVLGRLQRNEVPKPANDSAERALELETLDDMIQEELLIQKAADLKIDVADADVAQMVDRQVREVRSRYTTESEYRAALVASGLGAPEDYRKFILDQYKRRFLLEKVISKLKQDNKIIPIQVTDAEIAAEFNRSKDFLPPKPPTVTFKQIVIAPQPTAAAKEAARARAESILVRLKAGADFEQTARHESMDPLTKESGGDLGWARRGDNVPEFDRWLFGGPFIAPLSPGQLSSVFETSRGFHIVRVDRAQTGEVKSHQILIVPAIDSNDVARTARLADSVADRLRHGVPFDTLAKKFHDYAGKEETSLLTPWVRDSLPLSYQKGFGTAKAGDVVSFQIPGSSQRPDVPKFVVAQLLTADEGGPQTLAELKAAVRSDLANRGGVRRYVDSLKKQTFVYIRLDALTAAGTETAAKPDKP